MTHKKLNICGWVGVLGVGVLLAVTLMCAPACQTPHRLEAGATLPLASPLLPSSDLLPLASRLSHRLEAGAPRRQWVIPWVEINSPLADILALSPGAVGAEPGQKCREFCAAGLAGWEPMARAVIVTTRAGNSTDLYPYLEQHKPAGIRHIIGGIKTSTTGAGAVILPDDDWADAAGWRKIAAELELIAELTGSKRVVVENEGSLRRFHRGEVSIDFARLSESLKPLRETGLRVWWWLPTVLADCEAFPDRRAQTARLVWTIAEAVPGSVIIGYDRSWPDCWDSPARIDRRRMTLAHAGGVGLIDIYYVRVDGYWRWKSGAARRCYTWAEFDACRAGIADRRVIAYMGLGEWQEAGRRQ